MISIDDYSDAVRRFAAMALARDDDRLELFVHGLQGDPVAETCIDLRGAVATQAERASRKAYLEIGLFQAPCEDRRLDWWLFYFDIAHAQANLQLETSCERYRRDHPLFMGAPGLFDSIRRSRSEEDHAAGSPDYELLDGTAVMAIEDSEVFNLGQGFGRLATPLAPGIPAWGKTAFPGAPLYVRLDPGFWSAEQPPMRLFEAAIAPANPAWMDTLALFPGQRSYAAYLLEDCEPGYDLDRCRDYRIRDLRRLEIVATRRKPDYLSMMIEELPRPDAPDGLMVGYCIHLDTRAGIGTPMAQARLQHLDLAINVYTGADRAARMDDSLQHGKVQDATYRTHLYRIEDIPFPALFTFAGLFLRSKTLFNEWLTDLGLDLPASLPGGH